GPRLLGLPALLLGHRALPDALGQGQEQGLRDGASRGRLRLPVGLAAGPLGGVVAGTGGERPGGLDGRQRTRLGGCGAGGRGLLRCRWRCRRRGHLPSLSVLTYLLTYRGEEPRPRRMCRSERSLGASK